eukprot:COSAG02_NODE_11994_length_1618_cov_1.010533_1_plen_277_part_00
MAISPSLVAMTRRVSVAAMHGVAVVVGDFLSSSPRSLQAVPLQRLLVAAIAIVAGAPRRVGSTPLVKSLASLLLATIMGRRSLLGSGELNSKVCSSLVAAASVAMATLHGTHALVGAQQLQLSISPASSVIPTNDYAGAGKNERLGDMDVYVVGNPTGGKAIILIYDIHGVSVQCRHNCDMLAQAGFLVVMPDLFRGSGRSDPNFKRPDAAAVDREILNSVVPFVRAKGGKQLGVVGFCFGGSAAMRLAGSGVFVACGGAYACSMLARKCRFERWS